MDDHFNQNAWDSIAASEQAWFTSVDSATLDRAALGDWSVSVTATRPVPHEWMGDIRGKDVLCLGAGGGHQGPILAAAGASVTVVDFSENQLAIDRQVASQNSLKLKTICADMRDLAGIEEGSFDLVLNPCSVNFCQQVEAVWTEARRVLKPAGFLIAGMLNPVNYLFDLESMNDGHFVVANAIPCRQEIESTPECPIPVEFGHSLESLVGGQLRAGLIIDRFAEDRWGGDSDPLSQHIAVFILTRACRR